ncbi:hypothetical protein L596_027729 [Steinernema carpocapsae]|uniref:NTR domain-containing protein n=1 Tax=Steinernema carpocapsae TaxID=34508 RepID=A0A4U5LWC8_STECR|nr:hypothetical protein L596_027729 [Steinernema carpocapsae]
MRIPRLLLLLSSVIGFSAACKCVHQKPEAVYCKSDWVARLHILSRSYWFGRTTYRVETNLFIKKPNSTEFKTPPKMFDIATESECALDDLKVGSKYILAGNYVDNSGLFTFITKHFRDLSGNFEVERCAQVNDAKGEIFAWAKPAAKRIERTLLGFRPQMCHKKHG